jgi:hypothetical protein
MEYELVLGICVFGVLVSFWSWLVIMGGNAVNTSGVGGLLSLQRMGYGLAQTALPGDKGGMELSRRTGMSLSHIVRLLPRCTTNVCDKAEKPL